MPELIRLFPGSKYVIDAKTAFIQRSISYEDLASAISKYPEVSIDVEKKFVDLIRNIPQAKDFAGRYPNSTYKTNAVINAFNTSDQSKEEITELKKSYPDHFYLSKSNIDNVTDFIKRNYLTGLSKLESFSNQLSVLEFYKKYSFIDYSSRDWDILETLWTVNYNKFRDGNLLVGQILSLPNDEDYRTLHIGSSTVKSFVDEKLKKEMGNVSIAEKYLLDSQNSQWEEWKQFKMIDAPWVEQSGDIKYLTYGVIKNSSKFDLPVKASFTLPLYKHTVEKILGITYSDRTELLGTGSVDFYFPKILAGESFPYCALFDFGNGTSASGFKFLILRAYSEIQTGSVSGTLSYNDNYISYDQLNKQKEWLGFLKNGFSSNVSVTDYLGILSGHGEYSKDYQLQRWEDFKQSVKQALVDAYAETYGSGGSSSYSSDQGTESNHAEQEVPQSDNHESSIYNIRYDDGVYKVAFRDGSILNVSIVFKRNEDGFDVYSVNWEDDGRQVSHEVYLVTDSNKTSGIFGAGTNDAYFGNMSTIMNGSYLGMKGKDEDKVVKYFVRAYYLH
jgi:hypothetical protein